MIEIITMHLNIIVCFWTHLDSSGLTFEMPQCQGLTRTCRSTGIGNFINKIQSNVIIYYPCTMLYILYIVLIVKVRG